MSENNTTTISISGKTCTLDVRGRFDFNRYTEFQQSVEKACAADSVREYIVNLKNTSYLDSSALGMLLSLDDVAKKQGRKVVLANPSGIVSQILHIARFEDLFEIR